MPIKILIAGDHPILRFRLTAYLDRQPDPRGWGGGRWGSSSAGNRKVLSRGSIIGLSNGQKPDIGPGIDISTRPPHKYDDRGSGDAIWEELISLKKARKQSNPAVPAPTQARTPTPEPNQSETLTPEPLGQGTPSGYGARPDPLASQGQARLASLAPAPSLNVAAWLKVAADFIRNLFSEIRAGMGFGGNREILAGSDLQTTLETLTITYTYDPLRRLTAADYDDGSYFHYEYDAVGNRLSEQTNSGTIAYAYDDANRLAAVGLVDYVWDNNGNLLSDDVYTYTYDHANHLIGVVGEGLEISYVYNGLGERISQTVGSTTTNYTLDLAAGLSQVLEDETYTYLYGVGRIVQYDESDSQYFLGDALGSVRQVVDGDGNVILVKEYKPYGEVLGSTGEGDSSYGFTGEMTDSYIKLIYLRSRMYSPATGRFLTKDSWQGNYTRPLSLKGWNYVEANPINLLDPSGKDPYCSNPFANPLECNPPNIDNYNEKQEPESISWISNVYGDNVSSHLAPIYDKNGQIVYRTNAAQFKISGHEMNCEYEHDENEKIVCKPDSTFNQNFCGQVTISAIVYLFDKSSTARRIVEDMAEKMGIGKRDLTGYSTLKDYMNEYYNQYLYAEEKIVGRDFYEDQLPNYLKNNVISGNLIISAINILQGGSLVGGRVSPNGSIGHWVMITGVSREWNSADHFSPWNWVRIFNPFDNETEYYWWDDFGKSWKQNAGYKMLLVKPLPQKENCDGVTC